MRKLFAPVAIIFIGNTVHRVWNEINKRENEGGTFQRTGGALGFIFNSTLALPQSLYETLPAYYLSHPPQK